MVSTPVKESQTLSVTYGTDGTKIASGSTTPGATNWQVYSKDGIYVDVDTSAAGFTKTPVYVTSIGGDSQHWGITGGSSVYQVTAKGFRVYIRWDKTSETTQALTPEGANGNKWYINWIAFEPSSGTSAQPSPTQKTPLPTPGKYYYLVAKHSQKVLNVAGASKENNANIIQYDKGDNDNSKWLLEDAGDGSYFLVAKHSGKVANVAGSDTADGAKVIQYDKGNNDNSKWKLEDAGDGYFYLIAKHSGKVLQVNGGIKDNDRNVDQWTKQNVDHHKWKFVAV